jgi:hypothetical protein
MSDLDWGTFYEEMWGHPAHTLEPASYAVLKSIEKSFYVKISNQGKLFVHQILVEISRAKLDPSYQQYVFFILVEQQKNWPAMTPQAKQALIAGRDIMVDVGVTPLYRSQLQIPTPQDEPKVQQIIEKVAFWCQTKMAGYLIGDYIKIISLHEKAFVQAVPEVNRKEAFSVLKYRFERTLKQTPNVFNFPNLLLRVLEIL